MSTLNITTTKGETMSKRKTIAEIKAEAREEGFEMALEVVEREWRRKVRLTATDPRGGEELWAVVEKLRPLHWLLIDDVKALALPRSGGEYTRTRKRCVVKAGHPHAGSRGFFLDGEGDGPVKVWFLGQRHHQIDSALIERADLELSEES